MSSRIFALVLFTLMAVACAGEPSLDSGRLLPGALDVSSHASPSDDGTDVEGAHLWQRGRGHSAERGGRARDCSGHSAPPATEPPVPEPAACLFGEQFSELRNHAQLRIVDEHWITALAQVPTELEQAQLVTAVRQSSHDDVVTAEEALARVDQQEIRRMDLHDTNDTPAFTVYEYGVGDNSYGAIFIFDTSELAASIHDGDLLNCEF